MCIIVEYEKQWNFLFKISIKNFDLKLMLKKKKKNFDGKNGLNRKKKSLKITKKKKNKKKTNPNHLEFLPLTENLHYPQC